MKASERHHLKENVFAEATMRLVAAATANQQRLLTIAGGVVVLAAAISGYAWWSKSVSDAAGAMLGNALATQQAQIVPASTLPGVSQAGGTFASEEARNEAALAAFEEVTTTYPGSDAALTARYHAGAALLALGRLADAEAAFRDVSASGANSVYGPPARLGLCDALLRQEKFDEAITELTALAAVRDGSFPVDGVLWQLGRAYLKADRKAEARAAFQRVIDEFPTSPYVAQARQQVSLLG